MDWFQSNQTQPQQPPHQNKDNFFEQSPSKLNEQNKETVFLKSLENGKFGFDDFPNIHVSASQ
jgi:hypothetical protein